MTPHPIDNAETPHQIATGDQKVVQSSMPPSWPERRAASKVTLPAGGSSEARGGRTLDRGVHLTSGGRAANSNAYPLVTTLDSTSAHAAPLAYASGWHDHADFGTSTQSTVCEPSGLSVTHRRARALTLTTASPHCLRRRDPTLLLLLFAVLLCGGCGSKVFRHNGAVNMAGGFNMTGDMTVDGKMDMGELKTTVSLSPNSRATPLTPIVVSGQATRSEKLAVLDVDDFLVDRNVGGIGSMGENPVALFHEKIDAIRNDKDIKAVVLRINSPGGGVTASDIMCHELARLKQDRDLPIIANIMTVGTGGAYYLANHCDAIIAHPTSIVGGIGVILNLYNLQDTMGQFNVLAMPIKSGERIDAGTPERPIEADELVMLQRIADGFHQRLIDQVKSKRPKLAESEDQWSDGSVMTGNEAQSMGLVDGVGYLDTAIELAKQQAGLKPDDRVVMYRRENDPAYTPLDVSPNQPVFSSLIPLRVPGLDRSTMPTFLYLWQSDPAMASLARP